MRVKTFIGKTRSDGWELWVSTIPAQYKGLGNFYTGLTLRNPQSSGIIVLSHYSANEEEASEVHIEYAISAKKLLSLSEVYL